MTDTNAPAVDTATVDIVPADAPAPAKKRTPKKRASAAAPGSSGAPDVGSAGGQATIPAAPAPALAPAPAPSTPSDTGGHEGPWWAASETAEPAAATPLPPAPPTTAPPAAAAPPSRAMGIASMVLGIIAFCGFGLVAPIGLVLGAASWRKEPTAKGSAITGLALNVLSILTWIVVAIVVVIGFALAGYRVTIR